VNSFAFIGSPRVTPFSPLGFYGVNISTTPEREGQFQIFQSNRGILSGVIGSHDTEVRLPNTGSWQCLGPVTLAYLSSIFAHWRLHLAACLRAH
jgi:hypothetical protein